MNSLVILETLRVWQQYNMTFTQFVSFVSSREPPIEPHMSDQQFLRCLRLVDKEPERTLVEQQTMTTEEMKSYNEVIRKLSVPTGRHFEL